MIKAAGGKQAVADLLGGLGQPPAPSTSSLADQLSGISVPSTSGSNANAFTDLLGQSAPPRTPEYEPITAYEKDGIRVVFRFSKSAGQDAVTDIEASYSNTSSQPVSDFSLQVSKVQLALHHREHKALALHVSLSFGLQ